MKVGERIKKRREELNMTQDELAKKVGYTSRSSVAKIESNANGILQSKLILFAKALQVTPAYIMGWEEDEQSQKNNDAITDIILKIRKDENLLKSIEELCELSSERLSSVRAFIALLKQQNTNDIK